MNNQQKQSQLTIKGFLKPDSQLPSMNIDVLRQNPVKYIFENSIISTVQGQTGHITITGNGQVSQNQIQVSRNSREAQEYEHIKQRNSTLAELSAVAAAVRAQVQFEICCNCIAYMSRLYILFLSHQYSGTFDVHAVY